MQIKISYADDHLQFERSFEVGDGATVAEALKQSEVNRLYPKMRPAVAYGVFSKKVSKDECLRPNDRLEIYLALNVDPKESRRRRAKSS